MMRKPILAISPAGPIRDYLTVHGGGVAADHDVASIAGAISALLKDDDLAHGSETLAAQFDARRVARQYVDAFSTLV
jgi:glycosyltransferase involved in cell wall biosynthesis